jgi:bifunctional non-homologous end joining protein LigD
MIDGEATVIGSDGLSQFDRLRTRDGGRAAILYAFDLIQHQGADLRQLPLIDRKQTLYKLIRNCKAGMLYSEDIAEEGQVVFAHACELGAEGIVSKRIDSPYRSGPHPAWVKVKNPSAIEAQRQRSELWNK